MNDEQATHRLGHVSIEPSTPVVAGTVGQWTISYTVGSYGIDEGGTIKIARRFAGDWERPQFSDPQAPAYCRVTTNGEASLAARYDPKAHVRPWMKCIVIDVYDGCLAPGDVVTVVLGDQSEGSPGIRAQTFIETAHEVRVLVDPTNACLVRRLPTSPVLKIVSGEAASVVPLLPTQATAGDTVEIFVKGEDAWGNPTEAPADVELAWDGDDGVTTIDGRQLRLGKAGRGRLIAHWRGHAYPSNPLRIEAERPRFGHYWADLHAQSDATVGTGTEREYFDFGRRWAHLDVMSHQGNDFQMTDEDWRRLNEVTAQSHEDGRFVVLPGFEWSANTTAGGDHNVIYAEEGLPIFRSSHWQIDEAEDERSPAHPASDLYAKLHAHVDPQKVVVAAHCGGRYADIRRYFDPKLMPLVEVASCWGVFEWLLWDAYDRGYRVGVMCNSDGHKGRPGAEGPGAGQFGIYGGLTCILAQSLTRAGVFEALKQRRCYGTTGPRIDLAVTVDGHPMGTIAPDKTKTHARVIARATGTAPIEALHVYCGRQRVHTARPPEFDDCARSRRIRLVWGGARIRGRGRRATWDGAIEVQGTTIERAATFGFDSPADGITDTSLTRVEFRSRTTGDQDGIDLWLAPSTGGPESVAFRSALGDLKVDLAGLDHEGITKSFGGLDLALTIARSPETLSTTTVALDESIPLATGGGVMVKVVQADGHLAWSSPVYLS